MGRLGVSCAVAVIVAATPTYVASGFSRTGCADQTTYVASGFSRTGCAGQTTYVGSGFSLTGCAGQTTYVESGFSRTGAAAQAKPEMQRIPQFDNDRAVSWRSVIPPHTESTLHRHDRYRSIVAIVGGDLKTVAADGKATVTRYETGKSYWQAPMAPGEMHKDVNDTDKTIELIVVEMK